MATYQGQKVEIVRAAKKDDAGFDATKDQVVIRMPNGSEKVVLRSDVTEAP